MQAGQGDSPPGPFTLKGGLPYVGAQKDFD